MGDLRLVPALDRLVRLSAQPGWAWAPVDRRGQDGTAHPLCQRSFVRAMVLAAAAAGLSARMSFEVEWILSSGPGPEVVPATTEPAYGMSRLVDLSDYCRDLLVALEDESVAVDQLHPEYAPGQFELSVAAADPLAAADTNVLVRQTIRAVTLRHGMRASFAPAVVAGGVGNGGHLHLSLWRDGHSLMAGGPGPHGLDREAESFLAGVLEGLPALLAVGAPSVGSYQRLVPGRWSGPWQCWGRENREAALRLVTGSAGTESWAANAEVKCLDSSASPYLVVGAVLALGLAGLSGGKGLPPEVTVDPAGLPEAHLAVVGGGRLPTSLSEALEHFEASEVLAQAMGRRLFETFAAVRRAEVALFAGATADEVVAASRWRY
ncbi:MAG: glutamine synthetase [Acidimicrobiales bacterium]